MKILFDQGTSTPLRHAFIGHTISTAYEMGWSELDNGDLLRVAEKEFDALITTDKNLPYQQNIKSRRLAILVLPTTNWLKIQVYQEKIVIAAAALQPGDFLELNFT